MTGAPTPVRTKAEASVTRNAVMNLASYATTIILALLVSPAVIRNLGDERYGAWTLVAELIGYSGMLDVGVRWAVSYYVVQHLAREAWDDVNRFLSSAMVVMAVVGLLSTMLGVTFAWLFPVLFKIHPRYIFEVRFSLTLLSFVIGLSFPLEVYSAVLYAHRRLDVQSGIEIISAVSSSVGYLVVAVSGRGLIGLGFVLASTRVVTWVIRIWYTNRLTSRLRIHPTLFDMSAVRALLGFGSKNFAINVARTILTRTQSVIIGAFVSVEMITRYRIGGSLVEYVFSAVTAISLAFTPQFTYLLARSERDKAKELYLKATRISSACSFMVPAYVLVYGSVFLALWIGPKYVMGPLTTRSDIVMAVLLAGYIPRCVQSISWQFLAGAGRLDTMLWITIAEATTSIAFCMMFIRAWGIAGVAIGTALPSLILNTFVVPRQALHIIGISGREYWKLGVGRPVLCGALAYASAAVINMLLPPHSFGGLLLDSVLSAAIGAVLVWTLCLLPEDRVDFRGRAASLLDFGRLQ